MDIETRELIDKLREEIKILRNGLEKIADDVYNLGDRSYCELAARTISLADKIMRDL